MSNNLTRFKVNPKIIRTSVVKNNDDTYTYKIQYTQDFIQKVKSANNYDRLGIKCSDLGHVCYYTDPDPRVAADHALYKSKLQGMLGIDLDMEWAYPHPQKK